MRKGGVGFCPVGMVLSEFNILIKVVVCDYDRSA